MGGCSLLDVKYRRLLIVPEPHLWVPDARQVRCERTHGVAVRRALGWHNVGEDRFAEAVPS